MGSIGVEEISVPPFTLVGATTLPGDIDHPLRRRFPLLFELEPLSDSTLTELIQDRVANNRDPRNLNEYRGQESVKRLLRLHFQVLREPDQVVEGISQEASQFLARRSVHSPATSVQMIEHARVLAQSKGHTTVSLKDAKETLRMLEIDHNGLHKADRRVIRILLDRDNQPMGERALATALGASSRALRDMLEPRLVQLGLLELTSRGRKLTEKALREYK